MNILLIEDDEVLGWALSYKLIERGHQVYYAENGKKAVNISAEQDIDVIICDLMIPIVSGATFLSMRQNYISSEIPVIVISSLDEAENILRELEISFDFFIRKPILFDSLFELIDKFTPNNSIN